MALGKKKLQKITLGQASQLTGGVTDHLSPSLSPDGRWVTFSAEAGGHGHLHLYACDRQGRLARQLSASNGHNVRAAWSPDGRTVAFQVRKTEQGRWQIWLADLHGAWPARCLLQSTRFNYQHPTFTPDGRALVYASDQGGDVEGAYRIWRMDLESRDKVALTEDPLSLHLWPSLSPDGKLLLFCASDLEGQQGQLLLRDLGSEDLATPVLTDRRTWSQPRLVDQRLAVAVSFDPRANLHELRLVSLDSGKSSPLGEATLRAPATWVDAERAVHLCWSQIGDTQHKEIFLAPLEGYRATPNAAHIESKVQALF